MSDDIHVHVVDIIQAFACYQCLNRKGKEPCEYLPDNNELCTHYKWRYEQVFDNSESEEQEHE